MTRRYESASESLPNLVLLQYLIIYAFIHMPFNVKSYLLSVAYLKRAEARKVDQGDSSSLENPSGPTANQMSVEDLKHLSGLADIKVWKFS